MGYFPFYIDIKDKQCLIVGGGTVALRKLEKLIPFEPKITVVAPEIREEFYDFAAAVVKRKFEDSDLEGVFMVISASDDDSVNSHIFELCKQKNILVNTVDDRERCGFIFPAIAKSENITVGITTSGKSPLFARYLREKIEQLLDENCVEAVDTLYKYRTKIKSELPTEEARRLAFERILNIFVENGSIPCEEEIYKIIEDCKGKYEN